MTLVRLCHDRDHGALRLNSDDGIDLRAPTVPTDATWSDELISRYDRACQWGLSAEFLDIGKSLRAWLDDKFGWTNLWPRLTGPLVFEVSAAREPDAPEQWLIELPWELLVDDTGFLAGDATLLYSPLRRLGERGEPRGRGRGQLSLLFMAAAPRSQDELDFEAEEALIIERTAASGLDLFIEETATAVELGRRVEQLTAAPEHALHVLHLICHGLSSPTPMLCLEDDVGEVAWTRPEELLESLGPRAAEFGLLFLSACSSAAAGGLSRSEPSLAWSLIEAGLEAVIGWAAPVLDPSATDFAASVYQQLSRGRTLEQAVFHARWSQLTKPTPDFHWHLARLVLGPRGGGPLASPDGTRRPAAREHIAYLGDEHRSRVASPAEFVGRRRSLQDCIRALRQPDSVGIVIHGPAQVGKSSLAARLIHRLSEHDYVVEYGSFTAASLVKKISESLSHAVAAWYRKWALCPDRKLGAALDELLLNERRPLLLVLDNFEDVLETRPGSIPRVCDDAVELVTQLLAAFRRATNGSRLVLTSRHTFELPGAAAGLQRLLVPVGLSSFRTHESVKRAMREPPPEPGTVDIRLRCATACRNHPAILSLLLRSARAPTICERLIAEVVALDQVGSEVQEQELGELLARVAVDELLGGLSKGDLALLQRTLIVATPLPLAAAAVLASTTPPCSGEVVRLIELGVCEGLPDIGDPLQSAYQISPLVRAECRRRALERGWIADELYMALSRALVECLDECWSGIRMNVDNIASNLAGAELARLADELGDWPRVARFARLALAWQMRISRPLKARNFAKALIHELEGRSIELEVLLYYDVADLFRHSSDYEFRLACIERGLTEALPSLSASDPSWVRLLFERANAYLQSGALEAAEADCGALLRALDDTQELARAQVLSMLASIRHSQADYDTALDIHLNQLLPVYERLGRLSERAQSWKAVAQIHKLRGQHEQARRILTQDVLPAFERLGAKRAFAGSKLLEVEMLVNEGEFDRALALAQGELLATFEELDDDDGRAQVVNHVAHITMLRGDLDRALVLFRDDLLPLDRKRHDLAAEMVTQREIAAILKRKGDYDEVLRLIHEKLLPIHDRFENARERILTMQLLADVEQKRGRYERALAILDEQLMVCKRLGLPRDEAVTAGIVGDILELVGDIDGALKIRLERELPNYERCRDVPYTVLTRAKIARIWHQKGDLARARELLVTETLPKLAQLGMRVEYASALSELAEISAAMSLFDEAMAALKEALEIFEEARDRLSHTVVMHGIGRLARSCGDFVEYERLLSREVIPVYEELDNVREAARAKIELASVLQFQGRIDEASRMYDEALALAKRLGNDRLQASILGEIANNIERIGKFEAARRIRIERQLPIYDRIGDTLARARVRLRMAHQLWRHGRSDEALGILKDEVIPACEDGDATHDHAEALQLKAEILVSKGQHDLALEILREQVIPLREQTQHQYGRASALGQIALILYAQGHLKQALQLRLEHEIPIYEQVGNHRQRAVARGRVADILFELGQRAEALKIWRDETIPVHDRAHDELNLAIANGKIALVLQMQGKLAEAERTRRERELPVLERLGDARELVVARTNLAQLLIQRRRRRRKRRDDKAETLQLLRLALHGAIDAGLPERKTVERVIRIAGWDPGGPEFERSRT